MLVDHLKLFELEELMCRILVELKNKIIFILIIISYLAKNVLLVLAPSKLRTK
jgi:hypothetical protein